jgi:hypothetical protein
MLVHLPWLIPFLNGLLGEWNCRVCSVRVIVKPI